MSRQLPVGWTYLLLDNPLLREPKKLEHIAVLEPPIPFGGRIKVRKWGMKTSSRCPGRAPAMGSERRPSPERAATGEQLCLIDDDWRGMPDGVGVSPAVAIPDHGVKAGYHFAHDRNERDLWPFASGDEAAVEGSQHRVEPDRG